MHARVGGVCRCSCLLSEDWCRTAGLVSTIRAELPPFMTIPIILSQAGSRRTRTETNERCRDNCPYSYSTVLECKHPKNQLNLPPWRRVKSDKESRVRVGGFFFVEQTRMRSVPSCSPSKQSEQVGRGTLGKEAGRARYGLGRQILCI